MNIGIVVYALGRLLQLEAVMLIPSLAIALFNGEAAWSAFLIAIAVAAVVGTVATLKKPRQPLMRAREGFLIVTLAWVLFSLVGALPFFISNAIPSFIDSLFETISGFTTTGASVLTNIEVLPRSILFWRSFTHWIGGMGVLVLMLAILPGFETQSIHLMRAEMPGLTVGKLVSRAGVNARILYGIYLTLTIIEVLALLAGGMPLFDSVVAAFATAGTGGFAIYNTSFAAASVYTQYVISVFMILFSINFNLFYFALIRRFSEIWRSEELRVFLLIILAATGLIAWNTFSPSVSLAETFRHSLFQVSSFISTTGFISADYNTWPMLSQIILFFLMFVGACGGSTGGGIKVSRLIILFKSAVREMRTLISPRTVVSVKLDKRPVENTVVRGALAFLAAYVVLCGASIFLISLQNFDMTTTVTSVVTCIGNTGPAFGDVCGATGNFAAFSPFSKLVLSFDMLAGRLEIFPMLLLLLPSTFRKHT